MSLFKTIATLLKIDLRKSDHAHSIGQIKPIGLIFVATAFASTQSNAIANNVTPTIVGCPLASFYNPSLTSHTNTSINPTCVQPNESIPGSLDPYRYARNIWDLKAKDGRLYIGAGNASNVGTATNAGTAYGGTPIIYYDPVKNIFFKETIVTDEQIDKFVELQGRICAPGADPLQSWSMGNYYCQTSSNSWQMYRELPNALHTYDMISHGGITFAAVGLQYYAGRVDYFNQSTGIWSSLINSNRSVYSLMPVGSHLYTISELPNNDTDTTNFPHVHKINSTNGIPTVTATTNLSDTLFPNTTLSQTSRRRIYRNEKIGAQTLFIGAYIFNDLQSRPFGLYLASEAVNGNLAISRINSFPPSRPWDIIVRNDYIYVLTNNKWYTTQNSSPNTVKVFRAPRSNFS